MYIFITDIETDNLYFGVTKFHCSFIFDLESGRKKGFRPGTLEEYLSVLEKSDIVVGHNIIDYDLPTLSKLAGRDLTFNVFDTLVASRLYVPDIRGGHSLDAWGERLGFKKGDYGKVTENAWENFSEEMYKYCEQDVAVTEKLYVYLCDKLGFDKSNPPKNNITFRSKY